MATQAEQLTTEIDAYLDRLMEAGQDLIADYITAAIIDGHREGFSSDATEHRFRMEHSALQHVRNQVRQRINRRADHDSAQSADGVEQQYLLPGYKHLHRYYLVRRETDGEVQDVAVAIHAMTSLERRKRAQMFRRQGVALFEHATEMERFDDDSSTRAA